MRKLNPGAKAVLIGLAFLLTFALGLMLGAKVEAGVQRLAARKAMTERGIR